jgi:hypothetical protein
MALYDKPVRVLMREMVPNLGLTTGQIFTKSDAIAWFKTHYPLVKQGTIAAHLIRLSTNNRNRLHYNSRNDGSDDLFFQIDPSHFRLYQSQTDPTPITDSTPSESSLPPQTLEEDQGGNESKFRYEDDLRDYLAINLHLIEPGLRLYSDEDGEVTGVEYPVGGRFVDILAVDATGGYVVLELKVSRGYDRAVGQLLRYMTWIEQNYAEEGKKKVRGIIVARKISDDIRLACARIADVQLFEYSLSVALTPISDAAPRIT